jgi:nicotinamidase-related amidase
MADTPANKFVRAEAHLVNEITMQQAFDSVERFYRERGVFMNPRGFGKRPALVVVDMAYGWTDPTYASGSLRLDEAVRGIQQLLAVCRAKGIPIIYTSAVFHPDKPDGHLTHPEETKFRKWDARACEIDERLRPEPGELVILKENASAFFGTHLAPYLVEQGADTVIVTGCSTSACIRATVMDAISYRFRTIVPRQCVQDRAAESHEWNLFDMATKFCEVSDVERVLEYLDEWEPPL